MSHTSVATSSTASTAISSQPVVVPSISNLLQPPSTTVSSSQLHVTLPTSVSHPVVTPALRAPYTTSSSSTACSYTFYYQNMRSISNKLLDFASFFSNASYDFIAITETWLHADIADAELQLDNYHIFRCDRSAVNSSKCRGGGVLLAVRNHIPSKTYPVSLCDIETICVEIGP